MKLKLIVTAAMIHAAALSPMNLPARQNNDSLVLGNWKGTSICQVKNSPCHDEVVVYHISRGKNSNEYSLLANKIVNGAEEEMGILDFTLNPKENELTCIYKTDSVWKLKLTGDTMEGTLYHKGVLYRIIKVKKLK